MVKYSTVWRGFGNGVETTYSPPALPDNISDIEVYIDDTKTEDWNWVDGKIKFFVAPPEGSVVAIYRVTNPEQLPEFTPNTPITAGTLNSLREITKKSLEEAYDGAMDSIEYYIDSKALKEAAEISAANAANSESNAAQSAADAANSASAALSSEISAYQYDSEASHAYVGAYEAMQGAETSEANAAQSAAEAADSAASASQSAISALNSKNSASQSATEAANSATEAANSETQAANSATQAANSATEASDSAYNANNSANLAHSEAVSASNSATEAANSATTASQQASIATTKATQAADSETNAAVYYSSTKHIADLASQKGLPADMGFIDDKYFDEFIDCGNILAEVTDEDTVYNGQYMRYNMLPIVEILDGGGALGNASI